VYAKTHTDTASVAVSVVPVPNPSGIARQRPRWRLVLLLAGVIVGLVGMHELDPALIPVAGTSPAAVSSAAHGGDHFGLGAGTSHPMPMPAHMTSMCLGDGRSAGTMLAAPTLAIDQLIGPVAHRPCAATGGDTGSERGRPPPSLAELSVLRI
jgi:hypothetical protein